MCKLLTFVTFFILSSHLYAYQMVKIQTVSKTESTFVTRQAIKDGLMEGKEATFTGENVSIIARVLKVTNEFTLWEPANAMAKIPFQAGEIVTYYPTTEQLWALAPREVMAKYIQSSEYNTKVSLTFMSSYAQTYSEVVSGATEASSTRAGYDVEAGFDYELNRHWLLSFIGRLSQEGIVTGDASLTNDRVMGIAKLAYQFTPIDELYETRFYTAISTGYGQSQTATDGVTSAGQATLIPGMHIGAVIPMGKKFGIILEGALETLRTEESFDGGDDQEVNFNNAKATIGIRRFMSL